MSIPKILLILIAIILLYAFFAYIQFASILHYAHNPNIQQMDMTVGNGPLLRYVAAGDSTAVGIGASSVEQTYPYKLAEYFAKTNTVAYSNTAVSGATTADLIKNQLAKIIAYNPDIITISIGANDRTHLFSTTKTINDYKDIITTLTENTHAQIYLTNIPNFYRTELFPWPITPILELKSKTLNTTINLLATQRIHIVPIHGFGWNNFPDISSTYSLDHFHPNNLGYNNWTQAFLSVINN